MTRILIMTDGTCDIPPEWIKKFDIRLVHVYVNFGQDSYADDGIELTRTDFYRRLVSSPVTPTTAAPPPGKTLEVMHKALAEADHVMAFTAPARLSGIYATFHLAVQQVDPRRVTLIDSSMLSMGLGWQVIIAAEMAQAGASPAEIAAANRGLQPRCHVWAALDTLEYVRRSGRVSWAAAMVGGLLQFKPIIYQHASRIDSAARVRTSHRAFEVLVELAHRVAPLDRLAVMHTNNPDGAQRLVDALADIRPASEIVIVEATPVLGVHVGPNGLGLGVVQKTK